MPNTSEMGGLYWNGRIKAVYHFIVRMKSKLLK